jgi:hypothetical protein
MRFLNCIPQSMARSEIFKNLICIMVDNPVVFDYFVKTLFCLQLFFVCVKKIIL